MGRTIKDISLIEFVFQELNLVLLYMTRKALSVRYIPGNKLRNGYMERINQNCKKDERGGK